ncbi:beta-glucosidase BoGH3B-like [Salvia splendens]|uniref:beta-glucosidase BoGH3B-like n=1 Tax=Salvia splendens TaxID=180675 RepID=UPI001C2745B7|nr:beta-glucosidase BoGH3B-like [Salvia splendens]
MQQIKISYQSQFSKMADSSAFHLLLLLFCFLFATGDAEYTHPRQPLDARLRDLMSQMTLEEKIGQMTQIAKEVASPQIIKKHHIGSILIAPGGEPAIHASAEAWMDMADSFQEGALSTRLGIPLIIGVDALHGNNNAYNATIFPHNVGLGATRDPQLVQRIGAATALEVRATGIPYTFAPCIAVCRDPRWGRCYESYSEDPNIVREMTEIVPGLQGYLPAEYQRNFPYVNGSGKVAACAKHFVGDGGTTDGIDEYNTVIDWDGLKSIHMPAYVDSIRKGVATIMISYSSWNGKKMHTNYDLITGYLKNELKFKGFVISDSEGLDRITTPPRANYTYSVEAAINAGIDMVMVPYTYLEFINELTSLVSKGAVSMSRIDDAVERILRVKFIMGLFEQPLSDRTMVKHLGSQEHRRIAREAVRKSLVLLKNGKNVSKPLLPLPKNARRLLVAGSHANDIGRQCGGWTMDWQGQSGNITIGTSILSGVRDAVDQETEVVYIENPENAVAASLNFSFAIVVVGEEPYSEYEGDSKDLRLSEACYSTISNVCGVVECVVVVVSGRPVVMEPFVDEMDALVAAWLPGSEGGGVADVLFGDYGFSGKLPRTWFRRVEQLPMNKGDAHYDPLFGFGFGLTTMPSDGVGVAAE